MTLCIPKIIFKFFILLLLLIFFLVSQYMRMKAQTQKSIALKRNMKKLMTRLLPMVKNMINNKINKIK